jgi:hypothetical protein
MLTLADRNRLVLNTINTRGVTRDEKSYKAMTFRAIAEVTGMDHGLLRSTLNDLCKPTPFSEASLVSLRGDVYAQRIMVLGFDYHTVIERDDGRFAVRLGDSEVSVHGTLDRACDAAERADHEHVYGSCVMARPVDATYHGQHFNDSGEPVCYPEP